MRVTQEALRRFVNDHVTRRTRSDRNILAIYLCGSLLEGDYLLGGAGDVDLVFISVEPPSPDREIVRVTDEVHLDIAHHFHRDYRQPRQVRVHPWLGPTIFRCQILYDPQHFLDFTQASVRGQFDRSDYVLQRTRSQAEQARKTWMELWSERPAAGAAAMDVYLGAVEQAANAVASLNGPPLAERRFLRLFPERAEAVGRPGLYPGLLGLIGAPHMEIESLGTLLPEWEKSFNALPADAAQGNLHPARRLYYRKAFESLGRGPEPQAMLWPLVRTWTRMARQLPEESPGWQSWQAGLAQLDLLGEGFYSRVEALDAYLDLVEETIDRWEAENGG